MLSISELMRQDIAVVPPDASVRGVIEAMADLGVEAALVVDGRERLIGSIGDEQVVAGLHASRHRPWWRQLVADGGASWADERLVTLKAADIMLKRVIVVPPSGPVLPAIRLFDEYGVNVLAVVDHGVLVGALFRSDLVRRLLLPDPFGRPVAR